MIACIITGAGESRRFQSKVSKQYYEIDGRAVISKTVLAFKNHVDYIICTIKKGDEILFQKHCKDTNFVYGGITRQASVLQALMHLNQLPQKPNFVLITDGARPFVSDDLIQKIKQELLKGERAVLPAIKPHDTVRILKNDKLELLNRDELFFAQTPQGFDFNLIFNLHLKYQGENLTDDIALCEKEVDIKIKIIDGEKSNIKITTQDDL